MPQWQGSGSPGAHRLRRGAAELAGLFPGTARVRVATDGMPTRRRDGVVALDTLVANLRAIRAACADVRSDGRMLLTIGGDCGVDVAPVESALAQHGDRLAVVWFDAHADLNTPASSPSGAFHGMVLRTLLGAGPPELAPVRTLRPEQVVLAGVRALDPDERRFLAEQSIRHVPPSGFADPTALTDEVAATGANAVYLHIDLDVLDPDEFDAVGTPEPGGLTRHQLVDSVRALAARFAIAGVCVCEYESDGSRHPELLTELAGTLRTVLDGRTAETGTPTRRTDERDR
ncbi:arginase family protein [Micromonospora sonchi]|uniref:arginase family protein n=1 Tax=Micromonospora sonchi TaxID=1763543 RepID=UPI001E45B92E|nr:arginase family protein [Micromonospora sonchi]